jgi:hypothetical protein
MAVGLKDNGPVVTGHKCSSRRRRRRYRSASVARTLFDWQLITYTHWRVLAMGREEEEEDEKIKPQTV